MRLAAALLLWLAAACEGALRPVPFEEYAAAGADALCAWVVRCRHAPDDATCRRFLDPKRYDTRAADDGLRLGRLAYDPDAAATCLAAGRAAECSALPFSDASCARVFTGRVADGGACATLTDCATGTCVERTCDGACCVGVCAPAEPEPPPAPLRAIGAPCVTHTDCVDVAYCGDDWRCTALPREAGQHCLFGCYYGDLHCDVDTETCQAYAALGGGCGAERACNPVYAFCDGVCRPRPGVGEPCDLDARRCVPGTICVDGACMPRGGAGAPCGGDADCEVLCDHAAGTCVEYMTCLESR